jgi:hypothetical protein
MDGARWIVTLAGAVLIVAVNVWFFARRAPRPRPRDTRSGHGA